MDKNSLQSKTIIGSFWSFINLTSNYGVQFGVQIVLARILSPNDFGLIGILSVFIALSQSIVDSGFSNALIREVNTTNVDYSTVFYFNLSMSVVLYGLLFLVAPFIGNYFNEPMIVHLFRVISLVLIINSFGLIQRAIMIKNINFKSQAKISIFSSLTSGIIAIIAAFLGMGIWSLVIQSILLQFLQALLMTLTNKWVPDRTFSKESFKRLFGFSSKLLASGLLFSFCNNMYNIVIGKIYSTNALGYYTNAQKLRDIACQLFSSAVQKVSYPALSSIQNDNERLRLGYIKLIKMAAFINFPLMLGLAVVAEPVILITLGSKWTNSILMFQILCLSGALFPQHVINLNILQVRGRSDLFLKLEIVKVFLTFLAIVIVIILNLDLITLLWIIFIKSIIEFFVNSYYSEKMMDYSSIQQIVDVLPYLILTVVILGLVNIIFGDLNNLYIRLILQVISAVSLYILGAILLKFEEVKIIKDIYYLLSKKLINEK